MLVYEKGDPSDTANFRPITLQPVLYKIFSTIFRNRLQKFIDSNGYLNSSIQKVFLAGCDGVLEHRAYGQYNEVCQASSA